MPLLNYTTSVSVEKTVGQVQGILAKAGAREVLATFDGEGSPIGIRFTIETGHGKRGFTLPVNAEKVYGVISRYKSGVPQRYQSRDQARRIAWRIAKDWLEAQVAIVETEMVTFDEVMLPYMSMEGGRTLYELYADDQLPALRAAG